MKPRIVCAAVRHKRSGLIVCGARHFDKIMRLQIKATKYENWADADQGFIDQRGTYLNREEAWKLAHENGQIIRRFPADDGTLYSENLY